MGYLFPAEWHPHAATWLSWPHNDDTWPGNIAQIYAPYCQFIKEIAAGEMVCINVAGPEMEAFARQQLALQAVDLTAIRFYHHATNDAWCRDHGPGFLIHRLQKKKVLINWRYNAWGGKYPPFDLDDAIPAKIAGVLGIDVFEPGIVMEGGSVDFNGTGTVLTTRSCLLNPNRNPSLTQADIEAYLKYYYGVHTVWWLGEGIVGDDTDGHIDDITRFVAEDTVVTVVEVNPNDENYAPLQENLELLRSFRLLDGRPLTIITLPMPHPVYYENDRLPASYANFYIANSCVVVPTYRDEVNDAQALEVLRPLFPDKKVVGIDSVDLIRGLGSFHCLSQQEPAI